VLRAAGETETPQENIRDWLQLDVGAPAFQLLTEEGIAALIFFIHLLNFSIYLFSKFFVCFFALSFVNESGFPLSQR
jgi:hypothetical protein